MKPKTSAERVKLHRQRKKNNLVVVTYVIPFPFKKKLDDFVKNLLR